MTPAARRKQLRELRAAKKAAIDGQSLGVAGELHLRLILLQHGEVNFVLYPPQNDREGIDLLLKRQHLPGIVPLQSKARKPHRPNGSLELSIEEADLPPVDPKWIVVLEYLDAREDFGEQVWLIPDSVFRRLASRSAGSFHAAMSSSPTSRDRWVAYRMHERELPLALERLAARLAPRGRRRKR